MVYNCITVLLSFDFQNDYIESFNLESTSFNSLKNKKPKNEFIPFRLLFKLKLCPPPNIIPGV